MIENYLNAEAQQFLDRLRSDEEREWFWLVVKIIKEKFPNADHWITGGVDRNYIDIRIGKKTRNMKKGSPLFCFIKGPFCKLKNYKQLPVVANNMLTLKNAKKRTEVEEWLNNFTNMGGEFDGEGLNPRDYTENESYNLDDLNSDEETMLAKSDLNQILFGPPGTGKTYATIEETIKIVNPELWQRNPINADEYRKQLKAEFDKLVTSKQVRFVTFHQSFSYEDFVEGLRAKSEGENLTYSVEADVFKEICDQAAKGVTPDHDPFNLAVNAFIERYLDERPTLKTKKGNEFEVECAFKNKTFNAFPKDSIKGLKSATSWDAVRSLYMGAPRNEVEFPSYAAGMLDFLEKEFDLKAYSKETTERKLAEKFVLIIDEINRGNISRIFGELITLIEDSKRAGSEEMLEVTLPYSKESFSVPENLYILGTMNTADRSLAGLDIALRRRFTFIEMPPKPELLDKVIVSGGIDIGQMLRVMNQRIEVLLDANHCIGHAYFMPLKKEASLEKLSHIFKQKIIPLLQEYFFEDWQRIHWILNDHNKHTAAQFIVKNKSLEPLKLFGSTVGLPEQLDRWELNQSAFDLPESYFGIYSDASTLSNDKADEEPHE